MAAPDRPPASRSPLPALVGIAAIVLAVALAFAWTAGWLSPHKLTPTRFVDTIEKANGAVSPGYRRAHSKGLCVTGHFISNGEGAKLSKAAVLAPGVTTPILGRMSIGGGMPHAPDASGRVRSMALLLKSADGQEWRTAMNSFPVFMVSTAQGFYDLNVVSTPDPATHKPDPAKMGAFMQAHPESAAFFNWAKTAPWSTSFASTAYNGVDAFRFVDSNGSGHYVRWSMEPKTPFEEMTPEQLKAADPDFLFDDLTTRLATGPMRWDWVVTVAGEGDPIADPTRAWPEERQKITVGTLTLDHAESQATGACRDLNFDPLVLPTGVEGSDDPILAARSAIYSVSFNRRQHEIGAGEATEATGQAPAPASKSGGAQP